jgi:hypothetical protein
MINPIDRVHQPVLFHERRQFQHPAGTRYEMVCGDKPVPARQVSAAKRPPEAPAMGAPIIGKRQGKLRVKRVLHDIISSESAVSAQ